MEKNLFNTANMPLKSYVQIVEIHHIIMYK